MDSIVFDSVSKKFRHRPALFNIVGTERGGETLALTNISLSLKTGWVLALLGPNGSGKTTLLKLISTLLLPDGGRVIIHGRDTRTDGARVRREVGFAVAAERSFMPRLTARENLDFFAALDDVPRCLRRQQISELLERTNLLHAADTLVMKFSSGMYQRLAIARALLKKPSILLLDEPTRSIDPVGAEGFYDLIRVLRNEGHTMAIATHSFDEACRLGDEMVILDQGKIVAYQSPRNASIREIRSLFFRVTDDAQPLGIAVGSQA